MKDEISFMSQYDQEDTVKYIREHLEKTLGDRHTEVTDDDLFYFIDVIDDYFLSNDFTFSLTDEEVEIELKNIQDYMENAVQKDGMGPYNKDILREVVIAEYNFPNTF